MSITIYGAPYSTCTQRVLITLKEKNVEDYKIELVDLKTGAHKSPEFLARQPFGQIPVLKDGDVEVFESRAIARYVAEKEAGKGTELLGSTLKEKALVNTWLEVEAQNYNPIVSKLVAEKIFKTVFYGQAPDEAVAKELGEKLGKVLDIYEAHLSKSKYLAGDNFTLADLSHIPYTNLVFPAGFGDLITSRPNVSKWWTDITSRPSWKAVQELNKQ